MPLGVLVGDGRLGGISATLAAYDCLALRGHQVPLVVLMAGDSDGTKQLGNAAAIQKYLQGRAQVLEFPLCLPPCVEGAAGAGQPLKQHQHAPGIDANMVSWLAESTPQFDRMLLAAREAHELRVGGLVAAAGDARRMLWWPFTQHASVASDAGVTVIDGRVGEHFSVYSPPRAALAPAGSSTSSNTRTGVGGSGGSGGSGDLELLYDACASWWTQGVRECQPRQCC